ncbi:DNA-binding domain-containing protein [Nonomuraea sp. SYSU D8015]|uniref:DNA-binding domain-containing protein n=1 Tax=Nonomuraea sp. SYSU D8015 TaxID=2593644 RepID=UPI001660D97F|nr:DNA-binding domain-containing protein [Nonomuraea sp. SYSU D8015]
MDSGRAQIVERGVLTAPDETWGVAVRRAEVIGRLAAGPQAGLAAADAAAAELGLSRRQVYVLLGRWRAGEGVVSDLLPRRSSGSRRLGRVPAEVEAVMAEVIRSRYLDRQRRSVAVVYREVVRRCRAGGLPVPARSTLERRIEALDPAAAAAAEPLVLVHHEGDRDARRAELAGQGDGLVEFGGVVARVEIFSEKTRVTPPAWSASSWVSRDWRTVEARAYPIRTCPAGSAQEVIGQSWASTRR